MGRIKFKNTKQKELLTKALERLGCPTIKELSNRFSINYHTLKSYFSERRNLPESVFEDLVNASGINKENLVFETLNENYGNVLGGKKSRRFNKAQEKTD